MGHDLLNCVHFQQLVECAIESQSCGHEQPHD
jgi:hypothetical protein